MGLGCPHSLRWPQAGHTGAALSPLEELSTRTVPFHLPSCQHKPLHFHKGITKRRPRKVHGTSSACQIKWQQLCACKGFSGGHGHSPQPGITYSRVLAAATSTCTPTLTAILPPMPWGHCLGTDTSAASRGPGDLPPDVSVRLRTRPWHPSPS